MKLFEQFDAPNYVIRVAHIALDLAPPDDSNIVSIRVCLTVKTPQATKGGGGGMISLG